MQSSNNCYTLFNMNLVSIGTEESSTWGQWTILLLTILLADVFYVECSSINLDSHRVHKLTLQGQHNLYQTRVTIGKPFSPHIMYWAEVHKSMVHRLPVVCKKISGSLPLSSRLKWHQPWWQSQFIPLFPVHLT